MNSNSAGFIRGQLEAAGMGEMVFFLQKARQQIEYARYTLDNTDFSRSLEMLTSSEEKIQAIGRLVSEMEMDLARAEMAALLQVEEGEEQAEADKETKAKTDANRIVKSNPRAVSHGPIRTRRSMTAKE